MAAVCHELQALVDARLEKIYQPQAAVLLLTLHHPRQGRRRLLLTTEPTGPRVHLTEGKWSNPQAPPMFCMLLRKHLEGSRLLKVEQWGLERLLKFSFGGRDELGNAVTYRLVAEIMGRHSNILLVNQEDQIVDAITRVPPAMSSVRMVLPGLNYSYPDHEMRLDTLVLRGSEQLAEVMQLEPGLAVAKALVARLTGISPLLAKELLHRAELDSQQGVGELSDADWTALYQQLAMLQRVVNEASFQPSLKGNHFAALPLTHLEAELWPSSVNSLVDRHFTARGEAARLQRQQQKLSQIVRQLLQKNHRKEAYQAEELRQMEEDLSLRRWGELLVASLHLIEPKAERALVVDYYDPELPQVEIPLNPQYSGTQNAQRYFRRYERAKNGIPIVEKNLAKTRSTIGYLESLLDSIERAEQAELLAEIEHEMQQEGLLPPAEKKRTTVPKAESEPLRFVSPDGVEILVGRNNLQNERLTRRAAPEDWWLHTKDIPGSHVLVRARGAEMSPATLEMAAGLAAYYSKARQSSKVPVDYTRRKHVRKPPGSPPGFVIYTGQQTVLIEPRLPEVETSDRKGGGNMTV
jgi:predicted ribosome quality control (RQC) complex YloA/Tae2 family protein